MKTAQRILTTALALFNEHGESTVSSVDIANECDISPGNLYYHFKGKSQMVDGLMEWHYSQMTELLDTRRVQSLGVDDMFYYLFLLIQQIHVFRFLYRSPADLVEKYPSYAQQHGKLIRKLESTLAALFGCCHQQGTLSLTGTELEQLSMLASLIMTQSCQYDHIHENSQRRKQAHDHDDEQYHAISLLLAALGPRCTLSPDAETTLQLAIDSRNMGTVSQQE